MKPALQQLIASALGIVPLFHARAFNNLIVFVSLNIPSGASQPCFYFFWWFCTWLLELAKLGYVHLLRRFLS